MVSLAIEIPGVNGQADDLLERLARGLPDLGAAERAVAFRALLGALGDALPAETAQSLWEALPLDVCEPALAKGDPLGDDPNAAASLVLATGRRLPRAFPYHACLVARLGLEALADYLDAELVTELLKALPERTRKLWPVAVWRGSDDSRQNSSPRGVAAGQTRFDALRP